MVILSYEMIDELADQILTDYFGTPRFPLKKIDVDAFAKNYLKLDVAYDQLCYGGEIIYAVTAYKDSVVGFPTSASSDTMTIWTRSKGHRKNMRNCYTISMLPISDPAHWIWIL